MVRGGLGAPHLGSSINRRAGAERGFLPRPPATGRRKVRDRLLCCTGPKHGARLVRSGGAARTKGSCRPPRWKHATRGCLANSEPAGDGRRQDVGGPDAPHGLAGPASAIGEMCGDDHLGRLCKLRGGRRWVGGGYLWARTSGEGATSPHRAVDEVRPRHEKLEKLAPTTLMLSASFWDLIQPRMDNIRWPERRAPTRPAPDASRRRSTSRTVNPCTAAAGVRRGRGTACLRCAVAALERW